MPGMLRFDINKEVNNGKHFIEQTPTVASPNIFQPQRPSRIDSSPADGYLELAVGQTSVSGQ